MMMKILVFVLFAITFQTDAFSKEELNKIKSIVDQELKDQTEQIMNQIENESKEKRSDKNEDIEKKTAKTTKVLKETKKSVSDNGNDAKPRFPFSDVKKSDNNKEETSEIARRKTNNCYDVYGEEKCQVLHYDLGMACDEDRLSEFCEKTCGLCENCKLSQYGCCSDGQTSKTDPEGSECPECHDKHEKLCEKFQQDCNMPGLAGDWMRNNCLKTCEVCTTIPTEELHKVVQESCEDKEKYCEEWRDAELCEPLKDMMKKSCRKTCGYCHSNHVDNPEKIIIMEER